jgi:hypothetical protein
VKVDLLESEMKDGAIAVPSGILMSVKTQLSMVISDEIILMNVFLIMRDVKVEFTTSMIEEISPPIKIL